MNTSAEFYKFHSMVSVIPAWLQPESSDLAFIINVKIMDSPGFYHAGAGFRSIRV
jgi:hypothetical protein